MGTVNGNDHPVVSTGYKDTLHEETSGGVFDGSEVDLVFKDSSDARLKPEHVEEGIFLEDRADGGPYDSPDYDLNWGDVEITKEEDLFAVAWEGIAEQWKMIATAHVEQNAHFHALWVAKVQAFSKIEVENMQLKEQLKNLQEVKALVE